MLKRHSSYEISSVIWAGLNVLENSIVFVSRSERTWGYCTEILVQCVLTSCPRCKFCRSVFPSLLCFFPFPSSVVCALCRLLLSDSHSTHVASIHPSLCLSFLLLCRPLPSVYYPLLGSVTSSGCSCLCCLLSDPPPDVCSINQKWQTYQENYGLIAIV